MSSIIDLHSILLLLSNVVRIPYTNLFFAKTIKLTDVEYCTFLEYIYRRVNHEPIAKIVQTKEFYSLDFITTKDTLDPRPETEILIDAFKEMFKDHTAYLNILDLGCGSGCIAITILTIYKNAIATLADISEEAIKIAYKNAIKHNVINRCKFCITDWFSNIHEQFDIVLTNPPYVKTTEQLSKETMYDPAISLFAGEDGLDAYRHIFAKCHAEYVFTEIGQGQVEFVIDIAKKNFILLDIKNDFSGILRVLLFKKR